jgi:hypothetical protein
MDATRFPLASPPARAARVACLGALLAAAGCTAVVELPPYFPEGDQPGGGRGNEGENERDPRAEIDLSASGLLTSADQVPADGIAFIELTVQLLGNDGAPIVGRDVSLVASGLDSAILEGIAPTNVDGNTTARLRATSPGEVRIVAETEDLLAGTVRVADLVVVFAPCLSLEDTLVTQLWGPVFSRCVGCHNEYGLPVTDDWNNRHILKFPGEPEFAEYNVDVLRMLAMEDGDGTEGISYLVAMPTFRFGHSGGEVIEQGSPEEALLISFSERLRAGEDYCGPGAESPPEAVLADVGLLSRRETFARAKMALLGAPLDAADLSRPLANDADLEAAIDRLIDDPRAGNRLVEIYNDWLWTDRFTREVTRSTGGGNLALNRLNPQFPRRYYFQVQGTGGQQCNPDTAVCCGESGAPYPGSCEQPLTSNNAADSLAREPLELIRYIWNNDLRADAIANADFTVANPYTATLYGFGPGNAEWTFNNNNTPADDRNEFRPLVLRDSAANTINPQPDVGNRYPHAGILTTHAVLMRYPATTSNRQRRRASRIVYERFLGIDVMKLADFSTAGLPPDANLETATRTEIACTTCHAVMDPVARTLFSFNENSAYDATRRRPPAEEMFETSFMGERFCSASDNFCSGAVAGSNADQRTHEGDPVTWLAARVVNSPRFPYAMVLPLFSGLTGATVARPPSDPTSDRFEQKNLAFAIQNHYLTELAARFDTVHDRNLKALAKDILLGPIFRGAETSFAPDSVEAEALALAGVGRGVLITPEQLGRKIAALTDERVRQPANTGTADFLRDFEQFRLLLGGVNWESLTVRFRDPNPVMLRVIERMSNQIACRVVPKDFAKSSSANRRLLSADLSRADLDESRVRQEIAALRLRLLSEELSPTHQEISALYDLFLAARAAADAGPNDLPAACRVAADADHSALTADADGTIRGYMAVTAALLSDPLFIVE